MSDIAREKIKFIEKIGKADLPVIIAKTQFSLSDDQNKLGRPTDFMLTVRDIEVKCGAGFIVVIAGKMMLMPGLSKSPNAERIDILPDGKILNLS